jgi:hypothetical protein
VDGTTVSQSALKELIDRQKAVYASQNQEFPKEGSDSYENIQRNNVVYLVQQAEVQHEAKKLGVVVSQQDVDDALEAYIKSEFKGNRTEFQRSLKTQGFTLATFKESLRATVLTRKVLAAANKNVTVSDRDLMAYYKLNRATKYPNTPFKQVKESIYATLLSQKRAEANVAWIQNLSIRYEDKVDYAKGFEPPGS